MRLRDRGGARTASVVLICPVLHSEVPLPDEELSALLAPLPPVMTLPPATVAAINENYAGGSLDDPYAFPAGHDLRGWPATFIVNAEADSLRKSGEGFAAELARSGVDTVVVREPGTWHGYLSEPGGPAALRTLNHVFTWLSLH